MPYESEKQQCEGTCVVAHTPVKWNFWHFSFHWLSHDGQYLHQTNENKFKKGWARNLMSAARFALAGLAKSPLSSQKNIIEEIHYSN